MDKAGHLSDSEMLRFADRQSGETLAAAAQAHVLQCAECRMRLVEIETALAAYGEYHARVARPSLAESAEIEWPAITHRMREFDKGPRSSFFPPAIWWTAAAIACSLAVFVIVRRGQPVEPEMRQVLTRAVHAPEPVHRRLQFTTPGRSWYRPAVLPSGERGLSGGSDRIEALFVRANYSWEDPLSARSFAAWRKQLHRKHDEVRSIPGKDGRQEFYRLETNTDQGILRTAALTLRADNFAAVTGAFQFEGEQPVTVTDSGEMPEPAPPNETRQSVPGAGEHAIAAKVSEQDELRVFAALDAIGADAGEPIDVALDPAKQHVTVTGMGIPEVRQKEIYAALEGVPNVTAHFEPARRAPAGVPGNQSDTYSSDAAAPFRQMLEQRAGGSQALQIITDRALDTANMLLSQTHALSVLSEKFPPAVESGFAKNERDTLRELRHKHAAAIERAVLDLRGALKSLLSADTASDGSDATAAPWQERVAPLFEAARVLDAQVSRLLGGSYSEEWGRETLNQLPNELRRVETLAHAQTAAE